MYENAVTETTRRCIKSKQNGSGRMPRKLLENTIKELKQERGVSEHISYETVRSRIKRKNITQINNSIFLPIAYADKYIVETSIQMAKIKRSLSVSACIQLVYSMTCWYYSPEINSEIQEETQV